MVRLHLGHREVDAGLGEFPLGDTAFPHLLLVGRLQGRATEGGGGGIRGDHPSRGHVARRGTGVTSTVVARPVNIRPTAQGCRDTDRRTGRRGPLRQGPTRGRRCTGLQDLGRRKATHRFAPVGCGLAAGTFDTRSRLPRPPCLA